MGEGARRGRLPSVLKVAERRGLLLKGRLSGLESAAVFGGGLEELVGI